MKLNEKNYIERDVSWMYFNRRILDEAQRHDIPLMERLNFLGIYSNNLDEFFRVRVATLNRIVEYADMNSAFVLIHKVGRRQAIFCTEAVAEIVWRAKASKIGCLSDIVLAIEQKFAGKSQTAVADIFVGRKRSQSLDLAIER